MSSLMIVCIYTLPLNKEHQLRSGEGGQEVHDHTNCIYFLSSFRRVSNMMRKCLESLTCLMNLKDLHFPQEDNLCVHTYFEKGCQEKCTWQSRKVLWVVLSSLFFKEIWKNGTRGHGRMFASAKGKQQK